MRLIDADALLEVIGGYCDDREGLKEYVEESILQSHELYDLGYKEGYKDAEMSAVDAVPVVRCKNCGAYQTKDVSFPRCRITGRMKGTDDYCSSGYTEDGDSNAVD